MKRQVSIALLSLILIYPGQSIGQHKYFFNKDWEIIEDSTSAYYYRIGSQTEGIFHGPVQDYYMDGTLQMTGNYMNGRKHGHFIWYYENGQIHQEATYRWNTFTIQNYWNQKGKRVVKNGNGRKKWHYENGNLQSEYKFHKGKKQGKFNVFYRNGKIKSTGIYTKKGLRNYNFWTPEGQQLIIDGTGTYKDYFSNGNLRVKGAYSENRRKGLWNWYYENRQLRITREYTTEGDITGIQKRYYKDGILWFVTNYSKNSANYRKVRYFPHDSEELIIFEDNFESNINKWQEIKNDTFLAEVTNNSYLLVNSSFFPSFYSGIYLGFNLSGDYKIVTKIKWEKPSSGTYAGIIWGMKDYDNYNAFLMNAEGNFSALHMENNEASLLLPEVYVSEEKQEYTLEIKKQGDFLYFLVNHKEIGKSETIPLNGNYFGFLLMGKTSVVADNFKISIF